MELRAYQRNTNCGCSVLLRHFENRPRGAANGNNDWPHYQRD